MYKNLAQKWRPRKFSEVIGQDIVVTVLKNSLKSGRTVPAYLLSGPQGTGKTSVARILARTLNCNNPKDGEACLECESCKLSIEFNNPDIIEIDGASWRKLDNIRELSASLNYPPIGKRKVIIIDEIHMLIKEAFNALLKTIEEPPDYVTFIFATTEPGKVIPTILSRCQQFEFRRIPFRLISDQLEHICKKEGIEYEKAALDEVARFSDGSMRNAETAAEKLLLYSGGKILSKNVSKSLGVSSEEEINNYLSLIESEDIVGLEKFLNDIEEKNYDPYNFAKRAVMIAQNRVISGKSIHLWFNVADLLITAMIKSRMIGEPMLLLRNATFKAASLGKIESTTTFIESLIKKGETGIRNVTTIDTDILKEDNRQKIAVKPTNEISENKHEETTDIWNKLLDNLEEGYTKSCLKNYFGLEKSEGKWFLAQKSGNGGSYKRVKDEFEKINSAFSSLASCSIESIIDMRNKQENAPAKKVNAVQKKDDTEDETVKLLKERYNATIVWKSYV